VFLPDITESLPEARLLLPGNALRFPPPDAIVQHLRHRPEAELFFGCRIAAGSAGCIKQIADIARAGRDRNLPRLSDSFLVVGYDPIHISVQQEISDTVQHAFDALFRRENFFSVIVQPVAVAVILPPVLNVPGGMKHLVSCSGFQRQGSAVW